LQPGNGASSGEIFSVSLRQIHDHKKYRIKTSPHRLTNKEETYPEFSSTLMNARDISHVPQTTPISSSTPLLSSDEIPANSKLGNRHM
jgi:hypothetical protein